MQIGQAGIVLIQSFEGCHLTGYICPSGVPTIGCGYTDKINGKTITARTKITQQQGIGWVNQTQESRARFIFKAGAEGGNRDGRDKQNDSKR